MIRPKGLSSAVLFLLQKIKIKSRYLKRVDFIQAMEEVNRDF